MQLYLTDSSSLDRKTAALDRRRAPQASHRLSHRCLRGNETPSSLKVCVSSSPSLPERPPTSRVPITRSTGTSSERECTLNLRAARPRRSMQQRRSHGTDACRSRRRRPGACDNRALRTAVTFVLDGTLVDLRSVYIRAHQSAAQEVLGRELEEARVLELMATGKPIRSHMALLDEVAADRLVDAFIECAQAGRGAAASRSTGGGCHRRYRRRGPTD